MKARLLKLILWFRPLHVVTDEIEVGYVHQIHTKTWRGRVYILWDGYMYDSLKIYQEHLFKRLRPTLLKTAFASSALYKGISK